VKKVRLGKEDYLNRIGTRRFISGRGELRALAFGTDFVPSKPARIFTPRYVEPHTSLVQIAAAHAYAHTRALDADLVHPEVAKNIVESDYGTWYTNQALDVLVRSLVKPSLSPAELLKLGAVNHTLTAGRHFEVDQTPRDSLRRLSPRSKKRAKTRFDKEWAAFLGNPGYTGPWGKNAVVVAALARAELHGKKVDPAKLEQVASLGYEGMEGSGAGIRLSEEQVQTHRDRIVGLLLAPRITRYNLHCLAWSMFELATGLSHSQA